MFQFQGRGALLSKHCVNSSSTITEVASVRTGTTSARLNL